MTVLFFVFTILCGCEKTIEIDYRQFDFVEEIVVQAYLSSNGVDAYINKTVPSTTVNANSYLKNPEVWLYKNNEVFTQLIEKEQGHFVLQNNIELSNDANYKLLVNTEECGMAISNHTQIIDKSIVENVYVSYDSVHWTKKLHVDFIDCNPLENNYYLIDITSYSNDNSNSNFSLVGQLSDDGYISNKRTYVQHSAYAFDSTIIKIITFSDVIATFNESFYNNAMEYGNYTYEALYPVVNYVNNGYGFFGAYEICEYFFNPENGEIVNL